MGMVIIKSPQMVDELAISSMPPLLKVTLLVFPEAPTVKPTPLLVLNLIAAELLVVMLPIVTLLAVIDASALRVTFVATPVGTEAGLQLLAVCQFDVAPVKVWADAALNANKAKTNAIDRTPFFINTNYSNPKFTHNKLTVPFIIFNP